MIRVLQVVTKMDRAGLETMIMNYYRNIDRNVVQFDFLTHRPEKGDYGKEIEELGGHIYHLPCLNPFNKNYKKALNDFFSTHKDYKIVHVHQDCLSSVILKEAKKNGVPIRIAHCHSASQDKNLKYPIKLFYKRYINKYSTKLFACGEKAGKWMFGGADFEILKNAIDVSKFRFQKDIRNNVREEFGIRDEEIIIGHVGRFTDTKNHTMIIDIFKSLVEKNDKYRLFLVGNDKEELGPMIHQKIEKLNLKKNVIFTGTRMDVNRILMAMDLFVFPSKYEGFPVTLLEAQASGLKCFMSNRISKEVVITDLVTVINIDRSPLHWAEIINNNVVYLRKDTTEQIVLNGYDISNNAYKLQKYYCDMVDYE